LSRKCWRSEPTQPIARVSPPLLLLATDPLLVFTINDVTDLLWAEDSRARR
jgi:hypothetical protein